MKLRDVKERLEVHHADLSGSSFTDVNLSGTTYTDINMSGSSFDDINMSGWRVDKVNLSGLRLSHANLAGGSIKNCTPQTSEGRHRDSTGLPPSPSRSRRDYVARGR